MENRLVSLDLPVIHSQTSLTQWLRTNADKTFPISRKPEVESYFAACMPDAKPEEIDLYVSKLPHWFKITFN